jgi:SH3-like domain-containing protein
LKGAEVSILKEGANPDWAGWLWCRSKDGQQGWISKDFLDLANQQSALMNRDYDAKEVAVEISDRVELLKELGWAWVRKTDGAEGWVPMGCLGPSL